MTSSGGVENKLVDQMVGVLSRVEKENAVEKKEVDVDELARLAIRSHVDLPLNGVKVLDGVRASHGLRGCPSPAGCADSRGSTGMYGPSEGSHKQSPSSSWDTVMDYAECIDEGDPAYCDRKTERRHYEYLVTKAPDEFSRYSSTSLDEDPAFQMRALKRAARIEEYRLSRAARAGAHVVALSQISDPKKRRAAERRSKERMQKHTDRELAEDIDTLHRRVVCKDDRPWRHFVNLRKYQHDRLVRIVSGDLELTYDIEDNDLWNYMIELAVIYFKGLLDEMDGKPHKDRFASIIPESYGLYLLDEENYVFARSIAFSIKKYGQYGWNHEVRSIIRARYPPAAARWAWERILSEDLQLKSNGMPDFTYETLENVEKKALCYMICLGDILTYGRTKSLDEIRVRLLREGIEPNPGPKHASRNNKKINHRQRGSSDSTPSAPAPEPESKPVSDQPPVVSRDTNEHRTSGNTKKAKADKAQKRSAEARLRLLEQQHPHLYDDAAEYNAFLESFMSFLPLTISKFEFEMTSAFAVFYLTTPALRRSFNITSRLTNSKDWLTEFRAHFNLVRDSMPKPLLSIFAPDESRSFSALEHFINVSYPDDDPVPDSSNQSKSNPDSPVVTASAPAKPDPAGAATAAASTAQSDGYEVLDDSDDPIFTPKSPRSRSGSSPVPKTAAPTSRSRSQSTSFVLNKSVSLTPGVKKSSDIVLDMSKMQVPSPKSAPARPVQAVVQSVVADILDNDDDVDDGQHHQDDPLDLSSIKKHYPNALALATHMTGHTFDANQVRKAQMDILKYATIRTEGTTVLKLLRDKFKSLELANDRMVFYRTARGVSGDPPSFSDDDPINEFFIYESGYVETCGHGVQTDWLFIPDSFFTVAGNAAAFDDKSVRFKNIMQAINSHDNCRADMRKYPQYFAMFLTDIVFTLTSVIDPNRRVKFITEVGSIKPTLYNCNPPEDADARLKMHGFEMTEDTMALQAAQLRKIRAAKVRTKYVIEMPNWSDKPTNKAGLCKRLIPDTPAISDPQVVHDISQLVTDFIHFVQACNIPDRAKIELLEEALKGRPSYEKAQIRAGWELFMSPSTQQEAILLYKRTAYKAFWKLEGYLEMSRKPPRYIMSLPLALRGIQIAAMSNVLYILETATRMCNIKHLVGAAITARLITKFDSVDLCAETDFSSFESCISPAIKELIENRIFYELGDRDAKLFVDECLRRPTVYLVGPGFRCKEFHHIRMSGDYWTSIGNLVTNIIVSAYATERPVLRMMAEGMFEGDDGMYPAPRDPERVMDRATACGMILKLKIGPWYSLSFCGNNFSVLKDGTVHRCRDPFKVITGLTVLLGANQNSDKDDLQLQRSKCLSALDGPWVPGASAFAALFEYWSRNKVRVREDFLLKLGYLKEYSPYGIERCVPQWLKDCHDIWSLSMAVSRMDRWAGGIMLPHQCMRAISQFDSGYTDVDFLPPRDGPGLSRWIDYPTINMASRTLYPAPRSMYHEKRPPPSFYGSRFMWKGLPAKLGFRKRHLILGVGCLAVCLWLYNRWCVFPSFSLPTVQAASVAKPVPVAPTSPLPSPAPQLTSQAKSVIASRLHGALELCRSSISQLHHVVSSQAAHVVDRLPVATQAASSLLSGCRRTLGGFLSRSSISVGSALNSFKCTASHYMCDFSALVKQSATVVSNVVVETKPKMTGCYDAVVKKLFDSYDAVFDYLPVVKNWFYGSSDSIKSYVERKIVSKLKDFDYGKIVSGVVPNVRVYDYQRIIGNVVDYIKSWADPAAGMVDRILTKCSSVWHYVNDVNWAMMDKIASSFSKFNPEEFVREQFAQMMLNY